VILASSHLARRLADKSYIGTICLLTLAIFADYASRSGTGLGWGRPVW